MSFLRFFNLAILLAINATGEYSYHCVGDCVAGCEDGKLTPLFNSADKFSKQVLRCATHSLNATLDATFSGTIDAKSCKGKNRVYFPFPVGMEDFWNFGDDMTVHSGTIWHHVSDVTVSFTNQGDPCATDDLHDAWPVMSSDSMNSTGREINYKTMVFSDVSAEFAKHAKSISATFKLRNGQPVVGAPEGSWYECEAGCCMDARECMNSVMRKNITMPTFVDESDKCIASHKNCQFSISDEISITFAAEDIYICSTTDIAFPLNVTSPNFNPQVEHTMDLELDPAVVSPYVIRALLATEDLPCGSAQFDPWVELKKAEGTTWKISQVNPNVSKKLYGHLRFDHYTAYDLDSLSFIIHYGTLPDDK